jgi:undecaprenyl-diphosphatase
VFNPDAYILYRLNQYINISPAFDSFVYSLSHFNGIKMLPMALILWGLWFQKNLNITKKHDEILLALISSTLAMFLARLISVLSPYRLRPLHNPDMLLKLPPEVSLWELDGWNSFPSDTATLAFSLATGIFLINKRLGMLAYLHATIIICLPRIYLSFHYPSDILAGMILGTTITWVVMRKNLFQGLINKLLYFEDNYPATFYILLLLGYFQIATMFQSLREIIHFIISAFK